MRNKSSLMIIASMVFFLLGWNVGEAATWWVTKSGNDANTGNSIAASKLTIQAMINSGSVVNGDVIEIGSGTYTEQIIISSKSITLRGRGKDSTIIQSPTWGSMTIYDQTTLLYWNVSNIANSLLTSQFKPVIYVDAASNSYTVNIYGIKVNGNTEAPVTPTENFIGIMYKNAQGTVGNSNDTGKVWVTNIKGAGGTTENNRFGFGIMCIGTANPLIQHSTFQGYQNAAVASIGRSLSSTLTSQMPYPTVADCNITGVTQNNTTWYSGIMSAFGGKVKAQRNIVRAHRNSGGGFVPSGLLIYDGRDALIGSNSVKNDGNIITDNEWGLNIIVTNSIIGTPSLYTIKNNNIAYNGNGESGLTCSGTQATTGCVRYENTTSTSDRNLALPSNAWGNADPLNNGYAIYGGTNTTPVTAGSAADAFWAVTQGDKMSVTSPVFASIETVNLAYTSATSGWGYSTFSTIQEAINAAGNPSTVRVDSGTYTENVCVFNKNNVTIIGDSSATCGSGDKAVINPATGNGMHIFTLSGGTGRTTNIIVNGLYFQQVGTQRVGLLVTGTDNTAVDATNLPPTGIQVRNTCFEDYATQSADGTAAANAAMATEEYAFNNTGRQSYGQNVSPATANATDVDASANNNLNYNGTSTSPSFKVWDKTDEYLANGSVAYNAATILQTNLIVIYCGDDIDTALAGLGTSAVTVYLQGDCIYKTASTNLTMNGPFDMRVDYTGRNQVPPIVVAKNGIVYNNATGGMLWATDCSVATKPGIRFVTNGTQLPLADSLTNGHRPTDSVSTSGAYMKTLTTTGFTSKLYDYETSSYGQNRPANIIVSGNNDGALTDAITHIVDSNGYAGTVTLASGAAFTTNVDLQKRIRFAVTAAGNATTTGWIRLRNKVVPNGPDCATTANTTPLDGILDTRVTSGTFTSLDVRVGTPGSAVATEWADNTDTTNTIQQGLVFTRGASTGVCQVNNLGDYSTGTVQTPTISRTQTTLTSDDAAQFVQLEGGYITLNGSGAMATASTIVRFSVDTVKLALNTDYIQTAIGAAGSQEEEGVGLDNQAGNTTGATAIAPVTNRTGKIVFSYGGATPSDALIVEKDVKFIGNAGTPNTNSSSLTMRLGAKGTMIDSSSNFCNSTVNVTQAAGSGYTQIPDIQTGLLLNCSGGTVNVGTAATATTWGGGSDTYNRDNTISKPVTLQGTNTTNVCANATNGDGFYIDISASWPASPTRSVFTSTFSTFTAAAPIFKLDSAVNGVTIQGFDFTSIANGAAQAIVYSRKGNNTITLTGNVATNSSEQFVQADSLTTARTAWNIGCNRLTVTASAAPTYNIFLDDINGLTMANNNMSYSAALAGAEIVLLGGVNNLSFTDNVLEGSLRGGLYIHKTNGAAPSMNTPGGTNTILRNRFRANNSDNIASDGGLVIQDASTYTGTWTIANNFVSNNTRTGITLSGLAVAPLTIPSINTFVINDNSITGNTTGVEYLGLSTSGPNANCGINARGNWWNNASGPTSNYNPLNLTPCTATAYGDPVTQNAALTCPDSVTRVSFIPWWTSGAESGAGATINGWQPTGSANDILGRVVRTNSAGAFQASYTTITNGVTATAANDKVFVIQGLPSWTPAPGPAGAAAWGAYFSEAVPTPTGAGVETRGVTTSAWSCDSNKVKSASVYLAGTDNITHPVPSSFGAAIAPSTGTISGQAAVGFTVTQNNNIIRNFNIQGFSSTAPTRSSGVGIAIMGVPNTTIEYCNFNGGNTGSTFGGYGIYLDRVTGGASVNVVSNTFGDARDMRATNGGLGGVGIMINDGSNANAAAGPVTIGLSASSAYLNAVLGATAAALIGGRNTIRNSERAGIQIGGGGASNIPVANGGSAGASTIIQFNTIQGMRDARGNGAVTVLAGIYVDPTAGTVQISNNRIGDTTFAGVGSRLLPGDNKVDIYLGTQAFTFDAAGSTTNTIRSIDQAPDASDYTVNDEGGTRGANLRTFFNTASNTFSHAAILTTDGTKPYDFGTAMTSSSNVLPLSAATSSTAPGTTQARIYRKIATPMAAIGQQTFAAGTITITNVIEIRENAAWVPASGNTGATVSANQYYAENLALPSTTGIQNFVLLGPKPVNALNTTSAHIISSTGPGTSTAITASGAENKFIRGGIVLHAVGSGLYGSVPAGSANKGDVYLQRAASATDAGFVQFAYGATFGTQALVSGTGVETTGNNSNTDKPTIIKAGLDDANDDTYTNTAAQNRRTGVFQAGNGTAFTKPTEPIAGLGADGLNAYPNPATGGEVTVNFQVTNDTYVRVALYDALGRKVTDLKSDNVKAGIYTTGFDVSNLPSGTYTVRMEYDYFTKTVPVLVVK